MIDYNLFLRYARKSGIKSYSFKDKTEAFCKMIKAYLF